MPRSSLLALLCVPLLAGCGDAKTDSKTTPASSPAAKTTPATSDLQVLEEGDLKGVEFGQGPAFDVKTLADQVKVDRNPKEIADLKRDGWVEGRAVRFDTKGDGGYSTAERFRDDAAALRELKLSLTPSDDKGTKFTKGKVAGLPEGMFANYVNPSFSCRNVYFVQSATMYFTGYCTRRQDPGQAALVAAAKKVHARIS